MARVRRIPKPTPPQSGEPFLDSEEAWFWAVRGHDVLTDGARPLEGEARVPRPCEPRDIMVVLSRLVRKQVIDRQQVIILFRHARLGRPPDSRYRGEADAARAWLEALDRLSTELVRKGIVIPSGHAEGLREVKPMPARGTAR